MQFQLDRKPIFQFFVNPALRYRLARHGLLWTTALFAIFKRFEYNAILIPALEDRENYVYLSTFVFGGVTMLDYVLITFLLRHYVLNQFRIGYFVLGLLAVHILTTLLVQLHVILFVRWLSLSHLPIAYETFADHIMGLSLWQVPFDSVVVGIFCFSLVYSYLLYVLTLKVVKDLFVLRTNEARLEKENLTLEYQFLKAQINPHFLFNTLNNIYSFSITSPQKVPDTILKLADLMRYTLYETESQFVLLKNELSFLESYVQLQRIRHELDANIMYSVDGQARALVIPPLLLIVFIENAFKHGAQATVKAGWIHIEVKIEQNTLHLTVKNKLSNPTRMNGFAGGIGLSNARKRLELFYPEHHRLAITPLENEFCVNLSIDLHERAV